MPGEIKVGLSFLENEFRLIKNRLEREIKTLVTEKNNEKRETRIRAIAEEIVEFEKDIAKYKRRFERWNNEEPGEVLDDKGWYRCPRCWLKHGNLVSLDARGDPERFDCKKDGCFFSGLTPEGQEEEEEKNRNRPVVKGYGNL